MRAAQWYGHKDIRIEDIPEPTCQPGKVKVKPLYVGICGSDLHSYCKEGPAQKAPHPLTGETSPVGFGHEFSAIVKQVGEGVTSVKPDDLVAIIPLLNDGTCSSCQRGAPNCCRQTGIIGLTGGGGGLSESVVLPEKNLYKLPRTLDTKVGALIEPLSVAWHGVRLAGEVNTSTRALVLGAGPVGCATVLALAAKGVQTIIVSEPLPHRAQKAKDLGATCAFDPREMSVLEEIGKLTQGEGADVVFECAGVDATLDAACMAVRTHGQIINLGVFFGQAKLNYVPLMLKEALFRPSFGYTVQDFEEVIAAVASGILKPEGMITKYICMDDVVKDGIEILMRPDNEECKILIDLSLTKDQPGMVT